MGAPQKGFTPVYAVEYEYRLLTETPDTFRETDFTNIKLVNDVSTCKGVMHQSAWSEFFKSMRNICNQMEVVVASMHWEVTPARARPRVRIAPGWQH